MFARAAITRRSLLQVGSVGLGGLTLAGWSCLRRLITLAVPLLRSLRRSSARLRMTQ